MNKQDCFAALRKEHVRLGRPIHKYAKCSVEEIVTAAAEIRKKGKGLDHPEVLTADPCHPIPTEDIQACCKLFADVSSGWEHAARILNNKWYATVEPQTLYLENPPNHSKLLEEHTVPISDT